MNERSDSQSPRRAVTNAGGSRSGSRRSVLVVAVAGAGVALTVHHVAPGIPTVTPLIHRGSLEDGTGPVNSPRTIAASSFTRGDRRHGSNCATTARERRPSPPALRVRARPGLRLRAARPSRHLAPVPHQRHPDAAHEARRRALRRRGGQRANAAGALQRQIADLQVRTLPRESRDQSTARGGHARDGRDVHGDQRLCANGDDQVVRGTGQRGVLSTAEASVAAERERVGRPVRVATPTILPASRATASGPRAVYALSGGVRPSADINLVPGERGTLLSSNRPSARISGFS